MSFCVNSQIVLCVFMAGFDVRPLFSCSLHGKLLHHCCCGPPEAQEWQSEIKMTTIITYVYTRSSQFVNVRLYCYHECYCQYTQLNTEQLKDFHDWRKMFCVSKYHFVALMLE